jgi:hypothetical protein
MVYQSQDSTAWLTPKASLDKLSALAILSKWKTTQQNSALISVACAGI